MIRERQGMAYLFAGVLLLLAAALVARLVAEWRRYAGGKSVITRRQMMLRVVSAADMLLLVVLLGAGTRLRFSSVEVAVAYWALCLVLAVAAMVLAGWDLRLLRRSLRRRRAESYRRLSSYIRILERSRDGGEPRA
jgi:TRAP-type C4-dicarboxylate transport system permease large subunit